jgi:DNA sulfur modification protein DndE
MPDRIYTSSTAEEVLNTLRYVTHFEYSVLARVALALSLGKHGRNAPESVDLSGKEIRWTSLFSDDEHTFSGMLTMIYGEKMSKEDELFAHRVKYHIDSGCELLGQLFRSSGQDETIFFQRLAAEVPLSGSRVVAGGVPILNLVLGLKELNNERVVIELNNTARHANSHLAIMGKPGVGKTQLLVKILADIRVQSRFQTNFIYFDYKGDVVVNDRFVDVTRCTTYQLPHQQLPINPFVLEDYAPSSIMISAEEKAESFASIDSHIGTVQKGALSDAIRTAYDRRSAQALRYPDFREVLSIVRDRYAHDNKKDDSLIEILRRLSDFHLFWEHGSDQPLIDRISEHTFLVDLHQLPVLKELVVYLVIERLYKEMASLPDSETREGRRALRTILVIDEAHNYLAQKNPFLQKIIREGRSKGVVVFFASQSPNDYSQKFFDFKELLEFSFIFQCEGVSATAVQELLGCSAKTARELQVELARLRPFQVVSKSLADDAEFARFRADAFFRAYQ